MDLYSDLQLYGIMVDIKNSPSPYLIVDEDIWHNKNFEFEDGNSLILVLFFEKDDIYIIYMFFGERSESIIGLFSSKNDIKTIGEDNMRCARNKYRSLSFYFLIYLSNHCSPRNLIRYKMFWLIVFVTTSDEVQSVYNHDVDSHYAPRLIPIFIRSSYIVFFACFWFPDAKQQHYTASEIKVPILLFVIGLTDSSDGLLMKNLDHSDFSSIEKDRIILISTLVW
ncbi:hypothetical protein ACJIZ3_014432 [Penstemon smallii]|uniref:Uncharacterized protein n=1 Tax=Penstemon smallii TaxID=265156 RepID=A0ABD3RKB7_9LAMI